MTPISNTPPRPPKLLSFTLSHPPSRNQGATSFQSQPSQTAAPALAPPLDASIFHCLEPTLTDQWRYLVPIRAIPDRREVNWLATDIRKPSVRIKLPVVHRDSVQVGDCGDRCVALPFDRRNQSGTEWSVALVNKNFAAG